MSQVKTLTSSKYSKLVSDIRSIIEQGKVRAAQAASEELVVTYWEVGQRIAQAQLSDHAGYKAAVLSDIAQELEIDEGTLARAVQFFKAYKSAPRSGNINWSQYKVLIAMNNAKKRTFYEKLITDEALNKMQLMNAVRNQRFEETQSKSKTTHTIKRPTAPSFVYKAYVDRVIDGDTVLLRIDLGFQVLKNQRVRLAQIDTPAMDQPGGREAYKFVLDTLAEVEFVMVKTNKIDIYGRYVGHIFYSTSSNDRDEIFTKGTYLNQELLKKGLAIKL
jgi:endonuclease YncB( thermonuclease family)